MLLCQAAWPRPRADATAAHYLGPNPKRCYQPNALCLETSGDVVKDQWNFVSLRIRAYAYLV
jgi:hypothetical protein